MDDGELRAQIEIRNVVAAYANHADEGRFGELVALFAPDGVLEVIGQGRFAGRAEIAALFARAAADLAGATDVPRIRHHVASHFVQVGGDGPDTARSQCYWTALMDAGVDHWGRYRDRFVRVDGRWSIAHRRIFLDGVVPGGWGESGSQWVTPD
jgi:hypothetical protein